MGLGLVVQVEEEASVGLAAHHRLLAQLRLLVLVLQLLEEAVMRSEQHLILVVPLLGAPPLPSVVRRLLLEPHLGDLGARPHLARRDQILLEALQADLDRLLGLLAQTPSVQLQHLGRARQLSDRPQICLVNPQQLRLLELGRLGLLRLPHSILVARLRTICLEAQPLRPLVLALWALLALQV